MNNKLMNCAKSIDKAIPDLTQGMAIDKIDNIHKCTQNAFTCAAYAIMSASLAVGEVVELSVITTKTVTKKALVKGYDLYCDGIKATTVNNPVIIRR